MTEMIPVPICGREDWTILMPAERAARVQWPWHEWNRFHSMFHNLRPGDVLFDIGAEQGDQSALYQRWVQLEPYPDGGVIMLGDDVVATLGPSREGGIVLIEPNLRAWACIKAVWDANELRTPLAVSTDAVADERGPSPIVEQVGKLSNRTGWPDAARYPIHYPIGTAQDDELRFRITIDEIVKQTDLAPDAITIDIEGGEHDALRGAAFTLDEHKPLVWVSIHWQMLLERGQSRERLLMFMADLGYRHEHLGQDHEIHALFWHPEGRAPVLPYDGVMGS